MPTFFWNRKTGRYHDTNTKRFVARSVILKHIERQNRLSKTYLENQARRLVNREISLSQFQTIMMDEIKRSHIRMALLASGGKDGISKAGYGATGQILKNQYGFLSRFVNQIERGELIEKQIIRRAGLYASSSRIAFSKAELVNRQENGVQYAKRLLDSQAMHCPSCIRYERQEWTPIDQIVPRGVNCECHQNCRCIIVMNYSRNNFSDRFVS